MHSLNALRASALPLLLLVSGCVGAGLGRPGYVDVPRPPSRRGEQRVRVVELLEGPSLDLPRFLQAADAGNPRIAAARHSLGAASGRAWQAELYPNPTLGLETENVPANSPGLERSKNTISLMQPLIVGGRRSAAVAAARAEGDARALALEQTRRDVAAEARQLWTDLLYLQGAEELTRELSSAARSSHDVANTRLAARASPESEVLKAQIEVEQLQLRRRRLGRERRATLQRLAALVGLEELGEVHPLGKLSDALPALDLASLAATFADHPGLLAAQAEVEAALREVELAEAQRIPDVGIRLAYGRNNTTDQQILQGEIEIPLPLFKRNQGRVHEAEELAGEKERTAEAMQRRLEAELAGVLADYASGRDAASTHHERIVPAAQRAFTQVSAGYRAGRTGFLDLLDAQRTLAEVRLAHLAALRDAHRALARLTQLTGPLEARAP